MKITAVKPIVLGTPWRNLTIVTVETDEGVSGVGEVRMLNHKSRPGHIATTQAENASAAMDNDRLRGAALGDMPLVVLGAGTSIEHTPHWRESLEYQAGLSTNSRLAIIPGSDHSIHWEDPALVVSTCICVIPGC